MSFADIIPNPFAAVLLVNAALTGSPKVSRATSSGNGFGLPIILSMKNDLVLKLQTCPGPANFQGLPCENIYLVLQNPA